VACVKLDRHLAESKWLIGSPELVIEVKSPSNTKAQLRDKAMTTLAGSGSGEFWVVDPKTRTVSVYTKGGMHVYGADQAVPVSLFEGRIDAAAIFSPCDTI
jgi:Uma2 family endonuclease